MGRRSDINWQAIELEYRVGLLSVRNIAKKHGVADSNLRARARREGWSRQDGAEAHAAAREVLASQSADAAREIGAEIGGQQVQLYKEGVREATLTAIEVAEEHRRVARRGMVAASELLSQLEAAIGERRLIHDEIDLARRSDPARACLVDKMLGTRGLLEGLDRWAAIVTKLTSVEREAHGMNQAAPPSAIDDLLIRLAEERSTTDRVRPRLNS